MPAQEQRPPAPTGDSRHQVSTADFSEKSPWQRLVGSLFGFDFFISYAWADGRDYAVELAERLEAGVGGNQFTCFLDSDDYLKGDDWKEAGQESLERTTILILIGSPEALKSAAVLREVQVFTARKNRVIPIEFVDAQSQGTFNRELHPSAVHAHIQPEILRIQEPLAYRADAPQQLVGPSDDVVEQIAGSFNLITQQDKRARLLGIAAIVFALVALFALVFWRSSEANFAEAENQRLQAESEARRARARQLAVESQLTFSTSPARSLELGVKSATVMQAAGQPIERVTQEALANALARTGGMAVDIQGEPALSAGFHAPSNRQIAITDGHVSVVSLADADESVVFAHAVEGPGVWALSTDACRFSLAHAAGITLWDLAEDPPRAERRFDVQPGFQVSGLFLVPDHSCLVAVARNEAERIQAVTVQPIDAPFERRELVRSELDNDFRFVGSNAGIFAAVIPAYFASPDDDRPQPSRIVKYSIANAMAGEEEVTGLRAIADVVSCFALSPDGSKLAVGARYSQFGDFAVNLMRLDDPAAEPVQLSAHTRRPNAAAFAPDSRWLVTCGEDRLICLWDTERPAGEPTQMRAGGTLSSLQLRARPALRGRQALALDATETNLLLAGRLVEGAERNLVQLWETTVSSVPSFSAQMMTQGGVPVTMTARDRPLDEVQRSQLHWHTGPLDELDVSPDGRWLISRAESVRRWDTRSPSISPFRWPLSSTPDAATIDARDRLVAVTGREMLIHDLGRLQADPVQVHDFGETEGFTRTKMAVSLTPDGAWCLISSYEYGSTFVFELYKMLPAPHLSQRFSVSLTGQRYMQTISPDGKWIACTGFSSSGKIFRRHVDWPEGKLDACDTPFLISPRSWIDNDGRLYTTDDKHALYRLSFSEDGPTLPLDPILPGEITIHAGLVARYDASRSLLELYALPKLDRPAFALRCATRPQVALSGDGRTCFTADGSGTVRCFEVAAEKVIVRSTLRLEASTTQRLAASHDGRWLAVYRADRQTEVWQLRPRQVRVRICAMGMPEAISSDGRFGLSIDGLQARLFHLQASELVELAAQAVGGTP